MILLPHAKRIAHDSGRGMGLPGLYSGRFLFGTSRTARIASNRLTARRHCNGWLSKWEHHERMAA